MNFLIKTTLTIMFLVTSGQAVSLMSPEWAEQACKIWNLDSSLTNMPDTWSRNDANRGYKIIHLYRTDCGEDSEVEMIISTKDLHTMCVYGGKVKYPSLNYTSDYKMHAETKRWQEMANGDYGPMRAISFRRLKVEGNKDEFTTYAPEQFERLLLIPKKIYSDDMCPRK